MNRLTTKERAQVVAALVEGASINSTVRMTGISKPTILKLIADLGKACKNYQDKHLRNLTCRRVQADEIWSFCFAKDKNLPARLRGKFGFGSVWTWTAVCADEACCDIIGRSGLSAMRQNPARSSQGNVLASYSAAYHITQRTQPHTRRSL